MRVNVIIPTYNRSWAVKRAIDSVFAQTYPHFQLIVVDDGSTDDTKRLLDTYDDPRMVVLTQPNRGVSAARNTGIRAGRGDLISLLDSDDLWLPDKLSRQVDFFEHHPDALICQTEEIWIRNGRRVNPKKRHQKPQGMIFEPSLALCLVSPSAVMIRRKLLDEVGLFDENLPACEDYDLWLRISWKYPIYLIDAPLIIKHGGHADQLSRAPELDKYRIAALCKLLDAEYLNKKQTQSALKMLKEKCRIYAGGCLKRNRQETAHHYLNLAQERLKRYSALL